MVKEKNLSKKFQDKAYVLTLLLYLAGIFWILSFAFDQSNKKLKPDENALSPQFTLATYQPDNAVEAIRIYNLLMAECDNSNVWDIECVRKIIIKNIYSRRMMPLMQSFAFSHMAGERKGVNLYAVIKARRGDGTESFILNIPTKLKGTDTVNSMGIGLVFSLIDAIKQGDYLAKDIVILFSESEIAGVQAWLHAYYKDASKNQFKHLDPVNVPLGSIEGAFSLEIPPGGEYDRPIYLLEGINGILPNYDIVAASRRCWASRKDPLFSSHPQTYRVLRQVLEPIFAARVTNRLITLFHMIKNLALCSPTGNHGAFQRYMIEAMTISAVEATPRGLRVAELAKMIERSVKTMNNLMEHLHHAASLYLISDADHFVPFANIMISFAFFGAMMLVSIVRSFLCVSEHLPKKEPLLMEILPQLKIASRWYFSYFSVCAIFWYLCINSPILSPPMQYGLLVAVIVGYMTVIFVGGKWIKQSAHPITRFVESFRLVALAIFALEMLVLAFLNFSLGLCFVVFIVPVYTMARTTHTALGRKFQTAIFSLWNPFIIMLILQAFVPNFRMLNYLQFLIREFHLLGNYLLFVIFCIYGPLHLVFSSIAVSEIL